MKSSATITLRIGNAVPPGNANDTEQVIALWQQLDGFFNQREFVAQGGIRKEAKPYLVTLDASGLLDTLVSAREQSETFSRYQKAHADDPARAIEGELIITVNSTREGLSEEESYQVAAVFIQQLVMAAHIVRPGSLQILNAAFAGETAHRYEAQNFDSGILYGAQKASIYNEWPVLQPPSFESVWDWLERCEVSRTHTAIRDINKVLFTLLKLAEQRHEYSARTVLLVIYQLEILLDCRHASSLELINRRCRMVLGKIPEAVDCFNELNEVRHKLFAGSQPVHRPALISHNIENVVREQTGQHNNAVEAGTALVMALLQDLISKQASAYEFNESVAPVTF